MDYSSSRGSSIYDFAQGLGISSNSQSEAYAPPSGLSGFLLINAVRAKTSIVIGDMIIVICLLSSKMTPAESKLVIFNHSDSKGDLQIPDLTGSTRIIQLTKCVSCPLPGLR